MSGVLRSLAIFDLQILGGPYESRFCDVFFEQDTTLSSFLGKVEFYDILHPDRKFPFRIDSAFDNFSRFTSSRDFRYHESLDQKRRAKWARNLGLQSTLEKGCTTFPKCSVAHGFLIIFNPKMDLATHGSFCFFKVPPRSPPPLELE